jgi:hypothetical protein
MATATWTKEKIKEAVQAFITKNGREPAHDDYLNDPALPHPRVIQRRFSGLKGLRTDLGLQTTNFTKGEPRRIAAEKSQSASRLMEAKTFNALFEKYDTDLEPGNIVQVSRQFQYQQYIPGANYYANTSVDMAISFRNRRHVIMIDVFHPADVRSLQGCVNIKKEKTEKHPVRLVSGVTHELLFVCTNPDITQDDIEKHVKKHKMYTVMSYDKFKHDILD